MNESCPTYGWLLGEAQLVTTLPLNLPTLPALPYLKTMNTLPFLTLPRLSDPTRPETLHLTSWKRCSKCFYHQLSSLFPLPFHSSVIVVPT